MKALDKMDNLDKAGLLCKLFPAELENLQNAIKKQCDYFLQNETAFREGWHQKGFFTAEFWYRLVQNAHITKQIRVSQFQCQRINERCYRKRINILRYSFLSRFYKPLRIGKIKRHRMV